MEVALGGDTEALRTRVQGRFPDAPAPRAVPCSDQRAAAREAPRPRCGPVRPSKGTGQRDPALAQPWGLRGPSVAPEQARWALGAKQPCPLLPPARTALRSRLGGEGSWQTHFVLRREAFICSPGRPSPAQLNSGSRPPKCCFEAGRRTEQRDYVIRPRLHSRAGQTPPPRGQGRSRPLTTSFSLLLSGLVLLGPEWSADGLRSLEIHAGLCLPAASPRASRAGDLSGMWWPKARVDLWVWNLHPQGLWGPAGWLPA